MLRLLRRGAPAAALVAVVLASGCSDATGTVRGGEALLTGTSSGAPTWTALYGDLFGPGGQASCTAQSTCHGVSTTKAAGISGFVCGLSKETCWKGMNALASAGNPSDPTTTPLYLSLHQASTSSDNALCNHNVIYSCNMPCGDPVLQPGDQPGCHTQSGTYTFTSDDLTRISTWIRQGAQDN